jgi:hypothetical protein
MRRQQHDVSAVIRLECESPPCGVVLSGESHDSNHGEAAVFDLLHLQVRILRRGLVLTEPQGIEAEVSGRRAKESLVPCSQLDSSDEGKDLR